MGSTWALDDQARQLTDRIGQGSFHVICELSERSFYQTPVWGVARHRGARLYSLAGLDTSAFVRCVGRVNHRRMFQFGLALRGVLQRSRHLRILTQNGTDIRMRWEQRPLHRLVARLLRQPRGYIAQPSGLLDPRWPMTYLGGQLTFQGIPETIEGTAVIDGRLWTPEGLGLLEQPLSVAIERGRVVEIAGCPATSQLLKRWFQGQTIRVEHFCMGFHPGARLSGKMLEAERAFGCITVGMGRHALHTDGVIRCPSIEADQNLIEAHGSFVSEELLSLQRELVEADEPTQSTSA